MERRNQAWTFADGLTADLGGPKSVAFFAKCEATIPFGKLADSVRDVFDDDEDSKGGTLNQTIHVLHTSEGIVLSPARPACGLTGIEVVPLTALFAFRRPRRRHTLAKTERSWIGELLARCANYLPWRNRPGGLHRISPRSRAAVLNMILYKLCAPLKEDPRPQMERQIEQMEVEAAVTEVVGPHAGRIARALKNFYHFLSEGGRNGRRFQLNNIEYDVVLERNNAVLIRKNFSDGAARQS